ncbi:hypothetical protein Cni_G11246 [Canna indica]|uniref:Uncharacterized protein n=1 Tax=Canna indica TaxID=4628 RepID=A0AAQ3K5R3_9LILI|nr:hypothetical protein Cni_G11246 [Canna indica]
MPARGRGGAGIRGRPSLPETSSSVSDVDRGHGIYEIYTYEAPWPIYAMNWSVRRDKPFRLAAASLMEDRDRNRVEIVQLDEARRRLLSHPFDFEHIYPPTKLMFFPDVHNHHPDLIATSSDVMRLWRVGESSLVELQSILAGNRASKYSGPLTSFDWNDEEPRRICTSSIDTTCTIWDIEREAVETQIVAHEKAVTDVSWGGVGIFASVSADGSVRAFDRRDTEHPTVLYQTSRPFSKPLVHVEWNKLDSRHIAFVMYDDPNVVLLDTRFPASPVIELREHNASANAVSWSPRNANRLCTCGDDANALIWDISYMVHNGDDQQQPPASADPPRLASYFTGAENPMTQIQWSKSHPDWMALTMPNKLQIIRVWHFHLYLSYKQFNYI